MTVPVDRVVIREIQLMLKTPFKSATGEEHHRRVIIVEAHADGVIGYGEASPLSSPHYTEETPETVWHALHAFLLPALWLPSGREASMKGTNGIRRHYMAKAGLDGALWDLRCKLKGVPLCQALGGTVDAVPAGIALGLPPTKEHLADQVQAAMDEGYRRIKVKIQPGFDIDPLTYLRRRFGDVPLAVDANGSYRRDHIDHLVLLDNMQLVAMEQPLPSGDFTGHAALQNRLNTPVCLDETIETVTDVTQVHELGSGRIVSVKPGRVGGLTNALAIHRRSLSHNMAVTVGGLLESDIGRAHCVALASLPGFTVPGDLSPSLRYFNESLVHPPFTMNAEGMMAVPKTPGIGVEVNRSLLEHVTVRTARFTPPSS